MKWADPRHENRGPHDDHIATSQGTADALARLHPRDRRRIAARVAELDDLGRMMREPGTLAQERAA